MAALFWLRQENQEFILHFTEPKDSLSYTRKALKKSKMWTFLAAFLRYFQNGDALDQHTVGNSRSVESVGTTQSRGVAAVRSQGFTSGECTKLAAGSPRN